jgi:capsular polysaccharide transport system permease protein
MTAPGDTISVPPPRMRAGRLVIGWRIQLRVIRALMIRELSTRFGRENIGFLWMMVEPLLFAVMVSIVWTILRGSTEHSGISTAAFVATGYIPLTLFRHALSRSVKIFSVNSSLMYHRQIKILDFIFVRFLIEMIGSMMAFLFIMVVFVFVGLMPLPANPPLLLAGWLEYALFTLALTLILAPLSEQSEFWEKIVPVTTYIMIPFSGAFTMNSWLAPSAREYLLWSPFVDAMEMIRGGVFGDLVNPIYDPVIPLVASLVCMVIGLAMCRRIRRTLAVE